jgi:colicin import membrane protein
MNDTPYSVPKEPGRWRAIALAVAVHVALVIFLWIGINWQSHPPEELQAEIWSEQARDSAPTPPEPDPKPQPKPEPDPVVKTPPKVEPDTPPPPKVDIALEKEKKRKEQEKLKQQAEQDRQDRLKKQKEAKAEQDRLQKEKLAEQKKADQQKQAAQDKQTLDKKRKQEAADAQLQKKIHDEEMRRLTGQVGSGGNGEAAKTQGSGRATDPSYADKIRSKIRMNTTFSVPEGLSGNPAAEYAVELLPDGSVRSINLSKSSGLPGFDEAVKRAIDRSQPFPPDKTGRVPTSITISSRPKDQ